MAEMNGQLVSCDRCGTQIFRKCAGEGEADGGFTRWNKFEPYPEGWEYVSDIGRVCPECNKKYKELLNTFMSGVNDNGREPN